MRGVRVLVADDDPDWRELMRDILESEGHTVAVAENGLAALDRLSDFEPFVIVSDLRMPGLDGRQLTGRVHARDRHIPVIVVTADKEQLAPGIPGAFRVVGKADAIEGVLAAVAAAVESRAATPRRTRGPGRLRRKLTRLGRMRATRWVVVAAGVASTIVIAGRLARAVYG